MKKILAILSVSFLALAFATSVSAVVDPNSAPLYNSNPFTCSTGAINTGGIVYGNVEMLLQGTQLVFTATLTGATLNSSYDIWVNQDPGACPLGAPSFPGAIMTNGSGNGTYSGSLTAVGTAVNFWISGVGGGQVLRSTALSEVNIIDSDSDNIPDISDNCPSVANPGQEDLDNNGIGNVCDARYGVIVTPADDEHVLGDLNLLAYLVDNDQDPIQWAVRKGTCAAATNTVMGNVDGKSDSFTWTYDTNIDLHTFMATKNTCGWETGEYSYCFIFNPTEDSGEADIRLIRTFHVDDCDVDNDGYTYIDDCNDNNPAINPGATEVCNGVDDNCVGGIDEGLTAPQAEKQDGVCAGSVQVCTGTGDWVEPDYTSLPYYEAEETRCDTLDNDCNGQVDEGGLCEFSCTTPSEDTHIPRVDLGTNRWIYSKDSKGDLNWITVKPKGGGKGPTFTPTLANTHQCGCEQILTWLHDNLPESYGEMNGHWKYGCSQSAIQDFMRLAKLSTFTATASLYYNGPTDSAPLYGSGPIVFTWNQITGHVTGGYYTEQVPANTGTLYYNMITGGSVVGSNVILTFDRVNPSIYHFTFNGTLVGNVLSGMMDGPYLFTATGTVTP